MLQQMAEQQDNQGVRCPVGKFVDHWILIQIVTGIMDPLAS